MVHYHIQYLNLLFLLPFRFYYVLSIIARYILTCRVSPLSPPFVQTDIFTLSVPPQPTAALLADLRAKAVGAGIASDAAAAAEMSYEEILKRLGEVRLRLL